MSNLKERFDSTCATPLDTEHDLSSIKRVCGDMTIKPSLRVVTSTHDWDRGLSLVMFVTHIFVEARLQDVSNSCSPFESAIDLAV